MTDKIKLRVQNIETYTKQLQKHADSLYVAAKEQGFKGAGWDAHEIVKYLMCIRYAANDILKEVQS